jgi:pyrroloquinoline quinone biosynthesis protein E
MDEPDCLRVLSQAAAIGVKEVAFSGGEPLIWSAIHTAVQTAKNLGLTVGVYTSGNVDQVDALFRGLHRKGLSRAVFSVFGGSESSHERVTRVRGSFESTLNAIGAAQTAGLVTEIHFVPMARTVEELPGVAQIAERIGVRRISILRFVPQGRGYLMRRHALTRVQNLRLKRMIERLRDSGVEIRTGSPYNALLLNERPGCYSAIDRLIIGPGLRVYPCDAFKQVEAEELVGTSKFSSLEEWTLEECWEKSPYLKAVRDCLTTPFVEPCVSCDLLEKCLSGCLAQKVLAYGDMAKRSDPMCLREKVTG